MPPWMAAKVALKAGWLALVGGLFLGLAGFALVQTVRIEGLQVWPLSIEGWKARADRQERQITEMIEAQGEAERQAQAALDAQEARYRAIAQRIEEDAQDETDRALRLADRFIAAGGLQRPAPAGNQPCSPVAASEDHRAADTAAASGTAQLDDADTDAQPDADRTAGTRGNYDFVTVSAADVRICTRNTIKAEAGRQLAIELQDASANSENLEP